MTSFATFSFLISRGSTLCYGIQDHWAKNASIPMVRSSILIFPNEHLPIFPLIAIIPHATAHQNCCWRRDILPLTDRSPATVQPTQDGPRVRECRPLHRSAGWSDNPNSNPMKSILICVLWIVAWTAGPLCCSSCSTNNNCFSKAGQPLTASQQVSLDSAITAAFKP